VVFGVTGGSAWRGGLVLYIRWCLGEREMVGGCIECIGSSYITSGALLLSFGCRMCNNEKRNNKERLADLSIRHF